MDNQQRLVEENINLVYSLISKKYPTYLHDEDIIQSGMLGLCKAAEKWDENKSKFSTYAWRCITNEINREFISRKSQSKNISLDTKIGKDGTIEEVLVGEEDVSFHNIDAFCEILSKEEVEVFDYDRLGLSSEEIATRTGMTLCKVQKMLRIIKIKWRDFNA